MRWRIAAILCVAACLTVDFFPSFGPPHFRYTGSDPATRVWNLGWPVVTAIYDKRGGLHVGPVGGVLYAIQAIGLAGVTIVIFVASRSGRARAKA